jgi:hypothetical protein
VLLSLAKMQPMHYRPKLLVAVKPLQKLRFIKEKKFWTIILIFYMFLSKTIIISPGILTHSFNIKADIGRRKHSKTA